MSSVLYNSLQILNVFGYRNDLSLSDKSDSDSPRTLQASLVDIAELGLSGLCQSCLLNISLYEAGMESAEEVARTIAQRVCLRSTQFSSEIIAQVKYVWLSLFYLIYITLFSSF